MRAALASAALVLAAVVVASGCVPRYVRPAPAVRTGTPRDQDIKSSPDKLTLKDLLDKFGNCAPLWCTPDSIPGKTRCACVSRPPSEQPD